MALRFEDVPVSLWQGQDQSKNSMLSVGTIIETIENMWFDVLNTSSVVAPRPVLTTRPGFASLPSISGVVTASRVTLSRNGMLIEDASSNPPRMQLYNTTAGTAIDVIPQGDIKAVTQAGMDTTYAGFQYNGYERAGFTTREGYWGTLSASNGTTDFWTRLRSSTLANQSVFEWFVVDKATQAVRGQGVYPIPFGDSVQDVDYCLLPGGNYACFLLYWGAAASSVKAICVDSSTGLQSGVTTNIATAGVNDIYNLDVAVDSASSKVACYFRISSTSTHFLKTLNTTTGLAALLTASWVEANFGGDYSSVVAGEGNSISVLGRNPVTPTQLRAMSMNATTGALSGAATTLLYTGAQELGLPVGIGAGNTLVIWVDESTAAGTIATNSALAKVKTVFVSCTQLTLAGITTRDQWGGLVNLSRPYRQVSTGRTYLLQGYPSSSWPATFLIDVSWHMTYWVVAAGTAQLPPQVVGRFQNGETGVTASQAGVYYPLLINSSRPRVPIGRRNYELDFTMLPGSAEANNLTYLAGACPMMFDGRCMSEEGFNYPPSLTLTATGAGGTCTAGSYLVAAVYEWVDSQGLTHLSAPTFASVTAVAGNQINATVGNLRTTWKDRVRIRLYRSTVNGGTVTPLVYWEGTATNDTQTSTQTVTLAGAAGYTDTTVQTLPTLYSAGGVVDHEPMPACNHVSFAKQRLWASQTERLQDVFFSLLTTSDDPPTFNASNFFLSLDQELGPVVGAHGWLDRTVYVCAKGVAVSQGDGPSDTAQGAFDVPQKLHETLLTPLSYHNSIVSTPDELWWLTQQGPRAVTRSLELKRDEDGRFSGSKAGFDLSDTASYVKSVFYPKYQKMLLYLDSYALVYDCRLGFWSKFTSSESKLSTFKDVALVNNVLYHTNRTNATIHYLAHGVNSDGNQSGTPVTITYDLRFGFLFAGGAVGYQRTRAARLEILGKYTVNATTLTVSVYELTQADDYLHQLTVLCSNLDYSQQHRMQIKNQKSSYHKLRITGGTFPAAGEAVSVSLYGFVLEVGLKSGAKNIYTLGRA